MIYNKPRKKYDLLVGQDGQLKTILTVHFFIFVRTGQND